jgi:pyruvate formate lyase activating enzyme
VKIILMKLLGIITEIKRYATHDGPGIRTAVFLKGCPLDCRWCSNPETKKKNPQLYFIQNRCKNSGSCIEICLEKIISSDIKNKIIRNRCTLCMKCAEECINKAFQQIGKEYTVDEIFNEIKKDIAFYGNDGGVTLSGGEPLFQPEFSIAVLKKCKENGISTVLDTSGFAKKEIIDEAAKYTDLVLYDIKHMDSEKHREETGVGNELILENAKRFSEKTKIRISFPLIPGFNDDEKNIEETARFAKSLNIDFIDINPFHTLGADKFGYLGLNDHYARYAEMKKENVIRTKNIIEKFNIKTTIGRMM